MPSPVVKSFESILTQEIFLSRIELIPHMLHTTLHTTPAITARQLTIYTCSFPP